MYILTFGNSDLCFNNNSLQLFNLLGNYLNANAMRNCFIYTLNELLIHVKANRGSIISGQLLMNGMYGKVFYFGWNKVNQSLQ